MTGRPYLVRVFTVLVALAVTEVASVGPAAAGATAAPALVLSVDAAPWVLPASGGIVTVTGHVKDATSCQLEVLLSFAIPVVYSHGSTTCSGGNFSAPVTFGANLASVGRTVVLALLARSATSMSSGRFYVHLEPGNQAVVPSTPLAPAQAPSVPVRDVKNLIWSGYVAFGGLYRAARGTFTVPALEPGTPKGASVSEWVGVDGVPKSGPFVYPAPSGTSIIQAGVYETRDPSSPDGYDVEPWWEAYPEPSVTITGLGVKTGDKVTVAVWETGPELWEMRVADDTNGLAYTTPPEPYAGPGVSAEWVVERPSNCPGLLSSCRPVQLAAYSPAVSFRGMQMAGGPQKALWDMTMLQGGQQVSKPSAFSPEGFSVSYTGPRSPGSGART
ncbi:MAG TPA: G1 family glutamic endopeptidase [Acidimicrobiales bacterium]|nr:G1 family glutamic endopeptidase [Acidimicrobiales bacterium]